MLWRRESPSNLTPNCSLGRPSHSTKIGMSMWLRDTKSKIPGLSSPKLQHHSVLSCEVVKLSLPYFSYMGMSGNCNIICNYCMSEIPCVNDGMWRVICNVRSHVGSLKVTKATCQESPSFGYKYILITFVRNFWEPRFWLGLDLEKAWEFCVILGLSVA